MPKQTYLHYKVEEEEGEGGGKGAGVLLLVVVVFAADFAALANNDPKSTFLPGPSAPCCIWIFWSCVFEVADMTRDDEVEEVEEVEEEEDDGDEEEE